MMLGMSLSTFTLVHVTRWLRRRQNRRSWSLKLYSWRSSSCWAFSRWRISVLNRC